MTIEQIITIFSSSTVTFVLSVMAFKYDFLKIKASTSQEVSKSDQEKITTADKTIDLVEKLRVTMDRQFDEMQKEIQELKKELGMWTNQCSICPNNKIKK